MKTNSRLEQAIFIHKFQFSYFQWCYNHTGSEREKCSVAWNLSGSEYFHCIVTLFSRLWSPSSTRLKIGCFVPSYWMNERHKNSVQGSKNYTCAAYIIITAGFTITSSQHQCLRHGYLGNLSAPAETASNLQGKIFDRKYI